MAAAADRLCGEAIYTGFARINFTYDIARLRVHGSSKRYVGERGFVT